MSSSSRAWRLTAGPFLALARSRCRSAAWALSLARLLLGTRGQLWAQPLWLLDYEKLRSGGRSESAPDDRAMIPRCRAHRTQPLASAGWNPGADGTGAATGARADTAAAAAARTGTGAGAESRAGAGARVGGRCRGGRWELQAARCRRSGGVPPAAHDGAAHLVVRPDTRSLATMQQSKTNALLNWCVPLGGRRKVIWLVVLLLWVPIAYTVVRYAHRLCLPALCTSCGGRKHESRLFSSLWSLLRQSVRLCFLVLRLRRFQGACSSSLWPGPLPSCAALALTPNSSRVSKRLALFSFQHTDVPWTVIVIRWCCLLQTSAQICSVISSRKGQAREYKEAPSHAHTRTHRTHTEVRSVAF
eukprot:COSAG06_NODE_16_length_34949_cov_31.500832_8_plen_359_part_00